MSNHLSLEAPWRNSLLTIWRIEAPLEAVYAPIHNSQRWPGWWPGAQKMEQTAVGDADGINSVRRYSWQGQWPCQVAFEVRTTHIEKLVAIALMAETVPPRAAAGWWLEHGRIDPATYDPL